MPKNTQSTNTQFNWFEVFKSGEHTDSKGNTQTFSDADLDSVVRNFIPKTSPLVIGHPKTDDPAWGWASELKTQNGSLFAKAEDVSAEFAQAVADKRYPNRSVRLNAVDGGFELGHIGFLGGKPPAVAGLQWQFNADDDTAQVFEFAADSVANRAADNHAPNNNATDNNLCITPLTVNNPEDEHNEEDSILTKEEQAALEAQAKADKKTIAQLEYNQRLVTARTFIDTTINGGKAPRLTNVEGLAEFMADLQSDDSKTFEFAAAEGDKSLKPAVWFKSFLQGLPEQHTLTKDFSKDDDENNEELDAQALAIKASDYQQAQADKGFVISISDAMTRIQGAQ